MLSISRDYPLILLSSGGAALSSPLVFFLSFSSSIVLLYLKRIIKNNHTFLIKTKFPQNQFSIDFIGKINIMILVYANEKQRKIYE